MHGWFTFANILCSWTEVTKAKIIYVTAMAVEVMSNLKHFTGFDTLECFGGNQLLTALVFARPRQA